MGTTERMGGTLRVVAGVAQRGDRWLVCQRPAHKRHGGQWEFPGGKLEPGEDLATALVRELREELDLRDVTPGRVLHVETSTNGRLVLHFMEASFQQEPRNLEHQAITWATLEEMRALDLAPGDRAFVDVLARG